jgi:hypothetical protein
LVTDGHRREGFSGGKRGAPWLGLGDLVLMQAERRQLRAGRLDLLLVDPEEPTRL